MQKKENRITFTIKTGYYFELLTPKTMKSLERTEIKITKHECCENIPHFEITKITLLHCNVADNGYQQDSELLDTFAPNKSFGQLLEISQTNLIF